MRDKFMCRETINICFSSDNNYAQHLAVTIASILKNSNKDDKFSFLVLDGNISEENKSKIESLKSIHDFEIEFVKVDNKLFAHCPIQDWTHLSIVTYYRLVLPDIKPYWDKIIYLDCDIIVNTSLRELFETDIKDNYFASVIDISSEKHARRLNLDTYYNTGVMLINAKHWREDNITNKMFKWIDSNQEKIVLHDQDILNASLCDNIFPLDTKWNALYQIRLLDRLKLEWENASIIHYADKKKPWVWYNGDEISKKYFEYLRLTPYRNFLHQYHIKVMPKSFILRFFSFLFDAGNIDVVTKYIRILGVKFEFNRKQPKLS